jgi:dTDP-4-amino-4,6-dideoxygalactose transaminase
VDKYTWVDLGSSFGASEVTAAFLWAQLERAEDITRRRVGIWETYHREFADLEAAGVLRRPTVPAECRHEGHLYYLLAPSREWRDRMIDRLRQEGVQAVFHYVPLHSAPAGRRHGRTAGDLDVTEEMSGRLLRLPLWVDMQAEHVERVVAGTRAAVADLAPV